MNILLDTHCWLWALHSPERLNTKVRAWIENPDNTVYLSAASVWEIAIKQKLGKLKLPTPVETYITSRMKQENFTELSISVHHAARVGLLPNHHRDPFDRMLIAQAQCEGLALVSVDTQLEKYEVQFVRAN